MSGRRRPLQEPRIGLLKRLPAQAERPHGPPRFCGRGSRLAGGDRGFRLGSLWMGQKTLVVVRIGPVKG